MLQVLIRFPTGERKERRFHSSATVTSLYDYVDSLDCMKAENYSLVSNFPRVTYGPEKHSLTLEEAGLHPQASLFIEIEQWCYRKTGTWKYRCSFFRICPVTVKDFQMYYTPQVHACSWNKIRPHQDQLTAARSCELWFVWKACLDSVSQSMTT